MARTRVRHSTQLLRDFALPTTIPEDAGFEEAIPKSPIIQPNSITLTTTGNIDDLDFGNANLIRINNATLATIRGLKAGADGQQVTIVSIGAGQVDFKHQDTGSSANNRLINNVTTFVTSLAPGFGDAIYQYDATTARWRLVHHNQGDALPLYATFDATKFTTNGATETWTVDSGDVGVLTYYISGNQVLVTAVLNTTTTGVAADATQLKIALPFTLARDSQNAGRRFIASTATGLLVWVTLFSSDNTIRIFDLSFAVWPLETNGLYIIFEVPGAIS